MERETVVRDAHNRPSPRRHSATYEVVLLERLHFFKLIEKEGQSLSGYEQKQELERMRDEGERRRDPKFRPPEKHPMAQAIPYSRLADDFDLKLAAKDERRWTITGRPEISGALSAPADPFSATEFRMEIDRAESQIVKLEFKHNFRTLSGIATVMVRQKAVDHIWMWTLVQTIPPPHNRPLAHFPRPRIDPIQTGWQTEYVRSDFRKTPLAYLHRLATRLYV